MAEFLANAAEFFAELEFWHWWLLAALLIAIEVVAPITVFLWPGIAAALVGVVLIAVPELGWQVQVLLFAALSMVSVMVWFGLVRGRLAETGDANLNRRGTRYIDREFTLAESMANGEGQLNIDDTTWRITGENMAAGDRVRVIAMDGATLLVERA